MVSPIPYRPTPYRLRVIRTVYGVPPSVTAPYKAPYDTHAFPPAAPSGTPHVLRTKLRLLRTLYGVYPP